MANVPKPITREDMYYSYIINGGGALPKPITRKDKYLYYLCVNGFGGGGTVTPEMIENAVNSYLDANPVEAGATEEQAAQIEANKEAIAKLQEDFDSLSAGDMSYDEMLDFLFADAEELDDGGEEDGEQ